MSYSLISIVLLASGLCTVCAAENAADDTPAARPEFSAWYRFESVTRLGRSTGDTPLPALQSAATWIPSGQARFGGGMRLPGRSGNGLYLPNPAAFFGETARQGTVALWVRRPEPQGDKTAVLFDFMVSSSNTLVDGHQTVMFIDGDQLLTWPALGRRMTVPDPLASGDWTHLALSWDCTDGAWLYVNGSQVAQQLGPFDPTPLSASWPGRIGCHSVAGGFPFAGDLDEVRLLNRRLTADDIAELHALDPTLPPLQATLRTDQVLDIRNEGDAPIVWQLDRWLPGREVQPPWYGYTPGNWLLQVWSAGPVAAQRLGDAQVLEPGVLVDEAVPFPTRYWGPGRVRLMVGEGFARQEATLSQVKRVWFRSIAQPPEYGLLDRQGLSVDIPRSKPVVAPAGEPLSLPLEIVNDMRRPVSTDLLVDLRGRSDRIQARRRLEIDLDAGETVTKTVGFRVRMGRGRFSVTVATRDGDQAVLLQRIPVFGTDDTSAEPFCAVGAAYTGDPDNDKLLERMASDGVQFVRLGGKGDSASFRQNLSAILGYGMKAWRTPAFSYRSVCADPQRLRALKQKAGQLGFAMRDNHAVVSQTMAGEGLAYPPCYCQHCNRQFQDWLEQTYGSLQRLNQAWDSEYPAWDAIEQLGSPEDVDMAAERLKMMQVALSLPEDNTQRWIRLFELDPPRAMAWRRWHDQLLLAWYDAFATVFRQRNGDTVPVGEQPCWPNFKTHVFFPLARIADIGGMDLYLPGEMKTTLGYAAELFLNFDMNASVYSNLDKRIMVNELYVQDRSPAGLAEAQGWWLAGRGYNLLTYFTYPYYNEGTRAGEPLIFGMFDKDNEPYPVYESFKRFSADFFAFNARYNAASLRRPKPRVALFMGDDMSLANILESGGATWNANGVHGHNGSYWLTERSGCPMDFIHDDTFSHLDRERVLVVPWSHVVRASTVDAILSFAEEGHAVIIDGPFAQYDENYRPYEVCPGAGAAERLSVRCSGFDTDKRSITLPNGTRAQVRGAPTDLVLQDDVEVLARDDDKRPVIVRAAVGRGSVTWLLSALGPEHRSRTPDAGVLRFWNDLLQQHGVTPRIEVTPLQEQPQVQSAQDLDHGGRGLESDAACLDVSWRIRNERELFVFAVSFFQPSEGTMRIRLPNDAFSVRDAVTGQPLPVAWDGTTVSFPLSLDAFGSNVVRLVALGEDEAPLKDW